MNPEPYSFCFLRYFHEPLSGEFANIGVLVWAPRRQYLGFEATNRYARLSRFFGGFESGDYLNLVSRLRTRFRQLADNYADADGFLPMEAREESAREVALRVVPHDSAALQWSMSGGGLTEDPEAELADLFQRHIARHDEEERKSGRNADEVYRQVYRKAFQTPVVRRNLREHHVEAPLAEHTFPQAWQNGRWNVYETLSFDLMDTEWIWSKAHRWESMTRYLKEAEDLSITYLLGSPQGRNEKAYGTAKLLLEKANAQLVEENEAEEFARDLERQIASAGHAPGRDA